MEHPALGHIEKTLADAYRKEIDQEENVWRSLPFFAATLALELAASFQLIIRLPPFWTLAGQASLTLLIVTGMSMFAALSLLAACISPTRFRYLSKEPLLLRYTDELIRAEQASETQGQVNPVDALALLKWELAHQFSVATDHNRRINKRRELLRAFAGLAVVGSVLSTLLLVAIAFAYYIPGTNPAGDGHGPPHAVTAPSQSPAHAKPAGGSDAGEAPRTTGPADADHHERVVGAPGRGSDR